MSTRSIQPLPTSRLPPSPPPPPPPSAATSFPLHPRRSSLLLLPLAAFLPSASPAAAFGIPGPKEWLREQKKKASGFVLAPIEASRRSLRSAYLILDDSGSSVDSEEIHNLLNTAARDCVPQTRNSVVAFQARTGVEVCTFRLIVKNAASLLDNSDPVKLETEAMLGELIRSFSFVGDVIDNADFQLTTDRQKAKDGLMDTMSALDKFEQGIKDCLGV